MCRGTEPLGGLGIGLGAVIALPRMGHVLAPCQVIRGPEG
jgi:hypothetical protein